MILERIRQIKDTIDIKRFSCGTFPKWARSNKRNLTVSVNRSLLDDDSVLWNMNGINACSDHIEMSGFYVSAIVSYGKDRKGRLRLNRHLIVPNERMKPNVTQSSFKMNFEKSPFKIYIDGAEHYERPFESRIRGLLEIKSNCSCAQVIRTFYPAVNSPALIEKIELKNKSDKAIEVRIAEKLIEKVFSKNACAFHSIRSGGGISFDLNYDSGDNRNHNKTVRLNAEDSVSFYAVYYAVKCTDRFSIDIKKEIADRECFIDEMFSSLRLETPSRELNAQFSHCVLRGSESIFKTKNGLMHAPGGGNYYAALWTNDQCEYANPFFPFSGYSYGIEQSINCYRLYEKYMDKSDKPIAEKPPLVSSIIACGDGYWNGAGDRGDCEMYAYGLSRFLLAIGDKDLMQSFFEDLIWCMDFALSRKTKNGVIASDSDELENRFESGSANLFTSCLAYDALKNCSIIAKILNKREMSDKWTHEAESLKEAIEAYFGANVEGYDTYRYYDGNTDLRAWICMPLTVEIFDRTDETVKALFSDRLYKDGMLKTSSDNSTTWDRSLLFAIRGTLLSGKTEDGVSAMLNYCQNRLLGSHAPYAFEAYPEGNRAHLAAESILFARAVTEGLFGIRVVGYKKIRIQPRLSKELNRIRLSGLSLFGMKFSIYCDNSVIAVETENQQYQSKSEAAVYDFENMRFEQTGLR